MLRTINKDDTSPPNRNNASSRLLGSSLDVGSTFDSGFTRTSLKWPLDNKVKPKSLHVTKHRLKMYEQDNISRVSNLLEKFKKTGFENKFLTGGNLRQININNTRISEPSIDN